MTDWQTIKLMGHTYFSAKGFRILTPLFLDSPYDFVAENNGVFIRVTVKKAGIKTKNSWSVSDAGSSKGLQKADIILAYLPEQDRFIELPGNHLSSVRSKSRVIPVNLIGDLRC